MYLLANDHTPWKNKKHCRHFWSKNLHEDLKKDNKQIKDGQF